MYTIHFQLKSFDIKYITQIETYLRGLLAFFKLHLLKVQCKPNQIKKITVLRSPHIDKKSREQFQMITHKKALVLALADKAVLFLILEILKDLKCVGVEIEILIEFITFSNINSNNNNQQCLCL